MTIKAEHNVQNDEITIESMTLAEKADFDKIQADHKKIVENKLLILNKLGITEDEAKLLFG